MNAAVLEDPGRTWSSSWHSASSAGVDGFLSYGLSDVVEVGGRLSFTSLFMSEGLQGRVGLLSEARGSGVSLAASAGINTNLFFVEDGVSVRVIDWSTPGLTLSKDVGAGFTPFANLSCDIRWQDNGAGSDYHGRIAHGLGLAVNLAGAPREDLVLEYRGVSDATGKVFEYQFAIGYIVER